MITSGNGQASTKSNFGFWGWFVILFAFLSFMLAGNLIIDSLNITLAAFHQLRGWNTGVLLSYSTIAGMIAVPSAALLGWMVKKFGMRLVYFGSMLIVAVCAFFWGHVTEIWQYALIVILVNIFGDGFGFICGSNLIASWFPTRKGVAMGWATIGFQASAVLVLPVFTLILNHFGLSIAYDGIGIALLAMAVVCLLFLHDNPEDCMCNPDNDHSKSLEEYRIMHEEALQYQKTSPFTIRRLLRTKQMWQLGLVNGFVQLAISALIAQLIPKLEECGVTQPRALLIYSAAAVIGGLFSYLWGMLDAKLGSKTATILMAVSHAVAAFACATTGTLFDSMGWIYFAALMVAINLGVSSNLVGSFTSTVFGRYDFANAFTPIYMLTVGLRALSFATVGLLYSATGSYTWPYLIAGLLSIAAMIITFFIDDTCIGRRF
jgi:nitrate/nitrite transporter NarK